MVHEYLQAKTVRTGSQSSHLYLTGRSSIMPEIRYYRVKQIRTVDVAATNNLDALNISASAFDNGMTHNRELLVEPEGNPWGYPTSDVEIIGVELELKK